MPPRRQSDICPNEQLFSKKDESLVAPGMHLEKTKPNGTNGRCRHGQNDPRTPFTYYKTAICKYFIAGDCNQGSACRHAHGEHELRVPGRVPSTQLQSLLELPKPVDSLQEYNGGRIVSSGQTFPDKSSTMIETKKQNPRICSESVHKENFGSAERGLEVSDDDSIRPEAQTSFDLKNGSSVRNSLPQKQSVARRPAKEWKRQTDAAEFQKDCSSKVAPPLPSIRNSQYSIPFNSVFNHLTIPYAISSPIIAPHVSKLPDSHIQRDFRTCVRCCRYFSCQNPPMELSTIPSTGLMSSNAIAPLLLSSALLHSHNDSGRMMLCANSSWDPSQPQSLPVMLMPITPGSPFIASTPYEGFDSLQGHHHTPYDAHCLNCGNLPESRQRKDCIKKKDNLSSENSFFKQAGCRPPTWQLQSRPLPVILMAPGNPFSPFSPLSPLSPKPNSVQFDFLRRIHTPFVYAECSAKKKRSSSRIKTAARPTDSAFCFHSLKPADGLPNGHCVPGQDLQRVTAAWFKHKNSRRLSASGADQRNYPQTRNKPLLPVNSRSHSPATDPQCMIPNLIHKDTDDCVSDDKSVTLSVYKNTVPDIKSSENYLSPTSTAAPDSSPTRLLYWATREQQDSPASWTSRREYQD